MLYLCPSCACEISPKAHIHGLKDDAAIFGHLDRDTKRRCYRPQIGLRGGLTVDQSTAYTIITTSTILTGLGELSAVLMGH